MKGKGGEKGWLPPPCLFEGGDATLGPLFWFSWVRVTVQAQGGGGGWKASPDLL